MAHYEHIDAKPVLGIDSSGSIVLAAQVLGRIVSLKPPTFHVSTWEAGRGREDLYLTPAEFAEWRRSFILPGLTN